MGRRRPSRKLEQVTEVCSFDEIETFEYFENGSRTPWRLTLTEDLPDRDPLGAPFESLPELVDELALEKTPAGGSECEARPANARQSC